MKALIFILLAQLALSEEAEVSSAGILTNDRWCFSSKDCAENNECRHKECVPVGRGKLSDLENCVEIEVHGLDETDYSREIQELKEYRRTFDGKPLAFMDGVYSIINEKSSNGGKAYKHIALPKSHGSWIRIAKRLGVIPVYLYWDTSRKTWTFDETLQPEQNKAVARSKETANENISAKRFSCRDDGFKHYIPASVTCKKYLGDAEDSEMEEDQLAAENKRLQETNRALRQALNEMAV